MPKSKIGVCKLCGNKTQLCYSHIINEFWYKPLYDTDGKFMKIDFLKLKRYKGHEQKGFREYLLCQDCESIFSKYEKYVAGLHSSKLINLDISKACNSLSGIDYKQLKLFQLSILWRCSVTTNPNFHVNLGKHSNIIKNMLINDDPGDFDDYPCQMICVLNENHIENTLILLDPGPPIDGHHNYRLIFGGFIWHYFVSSHKKPDDVLRAVCNQKGEMTIFCADWKEIEFLWKGFYKVYKNENNKP